MEDEKGLLLVYLGQGDPVMLPPLGLAMRALGRGFHVALVSFVHASDLGPQLAVPAPLQGRMTIMDTASEQSDPPDWTGLWAKASACLSSGKSELVILDMGPGADVFDVIGHSSMKTALLDRPAAVNAVVACEHAPEWLLELADMVTEVVRTRPGDQEARS